MSAGRVQDRIRALHLIGGAADRGPRATSRSAPDGMKAAGEALAAGCVSGHGRSGSGRLKTKKAPLEGGAKERHDEAIRGGRPQRMKLVDRTLVALTPVSTNRNSALVKILSVLPSTNVLRPSW